MLTEIGFIDVQVGPPVDTFGGAGGEDKARAYQVYGHAFLAVKPRPIAEVGASPVTEVLDAPGMACAALTPLIKQTMKRLVAGQLLKVDTDDSAARIGIPAWCRLTGNHLTDTVETGPNTTSFYITKGPQP